MTRYIEHNAALHDNTPVRLATLAKVAGMTAQHTQRVFRRVMGITPRQFADALRLRRLKQQLRKGDDVTTSLYQAGYGSSSRLYERSDAQLGMTPATYRRGGIGMTIAYTVVASPLGRMLVAATERGISAVYLGQADAPLEAALRAEYPRAQIHRDATGLRKWVSAILRQLDCGTRNPARGIAMPDGAGPSVRDAASAGADDVVGRVGAINSAAHLPLDVQATAFQKRVWDALRAIPYGSTKTYSQIAKSLGRPKATRAVARACATNPVSIVVPCHRVVRQDGNLAGYRWGLARKKTLLDGERRHAVASKQTAVDVKTRAKANARAAG
jgi:AraC family transcriptional regulator of adaptative response/methylated-DNA-[protein]-cysteine methyltransferase